MKQPCAAAKISSLRLKILETPLDKSILIRYKVLMMKMKIHYMAWEQGVEFSDLFFDAIDATVKQQELEATKDLK